MSLLLSFVFAHALNFSSASITSEIGVGDTIKSISVRDSIVDYAKTFLGSPYKYAQASPSGFDCSGFTWYVFNHFRVQIPRSSQAYATLGTRVTLETCRKGDIILFTGTNPKEKRVGHVGIIITNPGEPLMFIHSSSSDNHSGVVVTDYYNSRYSIRFIGVCSVLP